MKLESLILGFATALVMMLQAQANYGERLYRIYTSPLPLLDTFEAYPERNQDQHLPELMFSSRDLGKNTFTEGHRPYDTPFYRGALEVALKYLYPGLQIPPIPMEITYADRKGGRVRILRRTFLSIYTMRFKTLYSYRDCEIKFELNETLNRWDMWLEKIYFEFVDSYRHSSFVKKILSYTCLGADGKPKPGYDVIPLQRN